MKNKYQMVHTYKFDENLKEIGGKIQTQKTSFKTLESAINNADMWINKREKWITTTSLKITIIDKETNETCWEYLA
jgi:hypothetical protein